MQFLTVLYQNGLFSGRGSPCAIVTCQPAAIMRNTSVTIKLTLPRPVKVLPGQYINIWLPSVSLGSWMQSHPLTVTSWAPEKQETFELLLQPQKGQSASLYRQARAIDAASSLSLMALWTGPHGITYSVEEYENVILIASDAGLAAVTPYISMLIHGYNTRTMHIRRIHLIWQVEELDFAISSEHLLNRLLKHDPSKNGHVLSISIYIERVEQDHGNLSLSSHDRVLLYEGIPDYDAIIASEFSGEAIAKSSIVRDEHGKTLVMGK
ncbi:Cytochrome b245, heavy chain [Penicillium digitatum]|uniref:ferric-chelate reductase (NADPH) n=1 Tax=Penicillium digitatum TaxID=36651 RepID=A0A7T7BLG8_PENDI|nr:Cytochrome b245, heavy chain [Penicillium digitatum]